MWQVHEGMGWWMVFGGALMILFWVGIIGLVVWGIARLVGHEDSGPVSVTRQKPLDIARERYAKGEITQDQFEQIKRDLT
jgi:putative membrane protein